MRFLRAPVPRLAEAFARELAIASPLGRPQPAQERGVLGLADAAAQLERRRGVRRQPQADQAGLGDRVRRQPAAHA
jgi:hypothetical protein